MRRFLFRIFALVLFLVGYFFAYTRIYSFKQFISRQERLANVVNKTLGNTSSTYGIAIKNLKTGEEFFYNADRKFMTGSLYKLFVMIAALELIDENKINKDEIISGEAKDINKILGQDSEEADISEGVVSLSVWQAINQMISISHNYAAILLVERVGIDKIRDIVARFELKNTKLGTKDLPVTTARDILHFFDKLYERKGTSIWVSNNALSFLENQKINDRIPRYLPKDIKVAHKTGELVYDKHDAGIVFGKKGDYIIVILTESTNPVEAADQIAKISREVFFYFEK
jgi:beta-lactamase class A